MIRDAYKRLYEGLEPGRALIEGTIASSKRRRRRNRALLIPLVAVLLLGFAFAATQSSILGWVFGPVAPMPAAQKLVEAVGARVDGQLVSASVNEVFFDGQKGYVQWNLTTDSEEPLFVLRSAMSADGLRVNDDYMPPRASVYEEISLGQHRYDAGLTSIGPSPFGVALLGGNLSDTFRGINSFALSDEDRLNKPGLVSLQEPAEIRMSLLVFRAKAPIYTYGEGQDIEGEVPPLSIQSYDIPATFGSFSFDRERETFVETHDNPLTFGGIVTELDTTLPPGEVRVHEYITGKFLYKELWMEEEDSLLPRMGLKDEWDQMRKDPNLSEVERMRWYGMLLERMGYGEIVEEVTIAFPLAPKSELTTDTSIAGESTFALDFFRAEVTSADFNVLGGEIHIRLWPDYEKADPNIDWTNTAFDVYLYRDGKQIGDQPARISTNSLEGSGPELPWFGEIPADYIPTEYYEGDLLIDAVHEYPDTLVIVPLFADKDSFGATLSIPGDHSITVHLK